MTHFSLKLSCRFSNLDLRQGLLWKSYISFIRDTVEVFKDAFLFLFHYSFLPYMSWGTGGFDQPEDQFWLWGTGIRPTEDEQTEVAR